MKVAIGVEVNDAWEFIHIALGFEFNYLNLEIFYSNFSSGKTD